MNIDRSTLFLPIAIALLTACTDAKDQQSLALVTTTPTVLVSHPETYVFRAALQLSGTAEPNQIVKLYAMTSGLLQQLKADIGDFVKADQVLAILENPELHSSKARLSAELKGKESIYLRLKNIVEKTPQLTRVADVDNAEAEYKSIKAQLDGVLLQIGFLTVKAPFSGVITRRYAHKGAIIQSGMNETDAMPLFELQDIRTIRLRVDVPETDVARLDKNSLADITFPELPEARYSADVTRLAYGLDSATRTMRVEIDIDNVGYTIRPGMYAKVVFKNSQGESVLAVPNEAIGNIQGKSFVFLVKNGKAVKVDVTTGMRDEHYTELLDSTIIARDAVVIRGKELINDGAQVQVKSL